MEPSASRFHLERVRHPSPRWVTTRTVTKLQLKLEALAYIWETSYSAKFGTGILRG